MLQRVVGRREIASIYIRLWPLYILVTFTIFVFSIILANYFQIKKAKNGDMRHST